MRTKVVAIGLLLLGNAAMAGEFSNWGTITQTYTSGGWTMLSVTGVMKNPDGCPSTSVYALPVTATNYEAMLSSILAAQMAEKSVQFWLSGCSGQSSNYPRITSVKVNTS